MWTRVLTWAGNDWWDSCPFQDNMDWFFRAFNSTRIYEIFLKRAFGCTMGVTSMQHFHGTPVPELLCPGTIKGAFAKVLGESLRVYLDWLTAKGRANSKRLGEPPKNQRIPLGSLQSSKPAWILGEVRLASTVSSFGQASSVGQLPRICCVESRGSRLPSSNQRWLAGNSPINSYKYRKSSIIGGTFHCHVWLPAGKKIDQRSEISWKIDCWVRESTEVLLEPHVGPHLESRWRKVLVSIGDRQLCCSRQWCYSPCNNQGTTWIRASCTATTHTSVCSGPRNSTGAVWSDGCWERFDGWIVARYDRLSMTFQRCQWGVSNSWWRWVSCRPTRTFQALGRSDTCRSEVSLWIGQWAATTHFFL